jgi:hypothetical protein
MSPPPGYLKTRNSPEEKLTNMLAIETTKPVPLPIFAQHFVPARVIRAACATLVEKSPQLSSENSS